MSMFPIMRARNWPWQSPGENLASEFDRLLSRMAGDSGLAEDETAAYPVDMRETDETIVIEAELPGFRKEEIDVSLGAGRITISAERQSETEQEGVEHFKERRYTKVQRSFTLPSAVDEDQVEARLESGVLTLTLQKREEQKRRKITVK